VKLLTVVTKYDEELNCILIKITYQTHRNSYFGLNSRDFKTDDGFVFVSDLYPRVDIDNNIFYVRGSNYSLDNKIEILSNNTKHKNYIMSLQTAVNNYNVFFMNHVSHECSTSSCIIGGKCILNDIKISQNKTCLNYKKKSS
jgi:hypothetical protein